MACADEIQYDARRARVGGREVCAVVCFSTGTDSEWRLGRESCSQLGIGNVRLRVVARVCPGIADARMSMRKTTVECFFLSLVSRAHIHIQKTKRQDSLRARAARRCPCRAMSPHSSDIHCSAGLARRVSACPRPVADALCAARVLFTLTCGAQRPRRPPQQRRWRARPKWGRRPQALAPPPASAAARRWRRGSHSRLPCARPPSSRRASLAR